MAETKKAQVEIDPIIKDAQERARTAQMQARKLRKSAPANIRVAGERIAIPQKQLITKYAERDGCVQDGENGFHYMFGDRALSNRMPDKGYEPVLDNGEHVNYDGDPMWKIPTDIYEGMLEDNVARSDALLGGKTTEESAAEAAGIVSELVNKTLKPGDPDRASVLAEAGLSE